jgi:hypothetical protein
VRGGSGGLFFLSRLVAGCPVDEGSFYVSEIYYVPISSRSQSTIDFVDVTDVSA